MRKSFEHVKRAHRIIREVKIGMDRFFIVGGYLFPESEEERAKTTLPHEYLGKVVQDPLVQESVLSGRSLLDLPNDAPGYLSVKEILGKAGY